MATDGQCDYGDTETSSQGPTGTSAEPNNPGQIDDNQLSAAQDEYQPRNPTKSVITTIAKPEEDLMGDHKSYHQAITGKEAEQRLKRHGGSCYLTRFSENQERYILSVYQEKPNNKIKHFEIKIERGRCSIKGTEHAPFEEIGELLSYYERKRIDPAFTNIGTAYEERKYLQDLEREEREQEEREKRERRKRERQERERQERQERERQERQERERQERQERERQEREREEREEREQRWCTYL